VLRVPQEANVGYHNRGNGPQSRNDLSGIVEPTHMGVAGGEAPICQRKAWIILDREEQLRYGLTETAAGEMRSTYYKEHVPVRTRGLRRNEASACSIAMSDWPAHNLSVPLTSQPRAKFELSARARSTNAVMVPMSSPK